MKNTVPTFNITIEKNGVSGAGVYDTCSQTIEVRSFTTLKEARKELRKMKKSEGWKNYAGHTTKNGLEAFTNF